MKGDHHHQLMKVRSLKRKSLASVQSLWPATEEEQFNHC